MGDTPGFLPSYHLFLCHLLLKYMRLTPVIIKCFESLILLRIKTAIPTSLDPCQFTYRANRSTEDAISLTVHSVLSHLDRHGTYARMLFVDFSYAFNAAIPSMLILKIHDLGLGSLLCNWILSFFSECPQVVRLGTETESHPLFPLHT